jgi:hypothetical protein
VYKLSKDLCGLKQASWVWYARVKTLLLEYGYVMGSVDKTLFTLNHGTAFLLVQIYVDDMIFDGSSHSLMSSFQEMMENEFQMSMMGELTFILDIQVKQMKQGTFIYQDKYTKDLMKKFNMAELNPMSTPMSTATLLGLDEDGEAVDHREYRSMLAPSCTSRCHGQTFSSPCACVRAFRLPHALHIGRQFSESSGISNTHSILEFGILLLPH